MIKRVLDKVMLVPLDRVLTMRREVEDAGNYSEEQDASKNTLLALKSDQKKQVETKMRSYKFQQSILETQEWRNYQILKKSN